MLTFIKGFGPVVVCVACSLGCTAETSTPAPSPTMASATVGTLTVNWTIDGSTDPSRCNRSVASLMHIDVNNRDGTLAGTLDEACVAFGTSITLQPGEYTARAVLVDGSGNPRTSTLSLAPFRIEREDELVKPIEFPSESFE